jgi:hypothetical protein
MYVAIRQKDGSSVQKGLRGAFPNGPASKGKYLLGSSLTGRCFVGEVLTMG